MRMTKKKTRPSLVAFWLVVDLAVLGVIAVQWLPQPQVVEETQDDGHLQVGDLAPDFQLPTLDGKSTVTLSSFRGRKPVVLLFGSYTCPQVRNQFNGLKHMYERFGEEAEFFMVYVQEAHPIGGSILQENMNWGIRIPEHETLEDRRRAAATCAKAMNFKMPILLDNMDDTLTTEYSAWPTRVYLVDEDGRIAYKGDSSPVGLDLTGILHTLDGALEASASAAPDGQNAAVDNDDPEFVATGG
jgi:hypothetical protein